MKPARAILFAAIWAALQVCAVAEQPAATRPVAAEQVDYARDIKPLLEHKCSACHGALKQEAGLRLDASQLICQGGDSGPAIVPDKPDESLLLERVAAEPAERMPPDGDGTPLKAKEIALLRAWIAQGAKSPDKEDFVADTRQHWSHLPARRPPIPQPDNAAWPLNPIDSFIAAKHAELGLTPRADAEKETLLRRVYVDLIGLPPTREELHAFLDDASPDAYERVVDRLLESPQFGQRWGRHWMDVWRYSDWYGSRGINEIRYSQRHIWRWRDWIVDSLNADKGYDRMIVEMLAGDEAAPGDPDVLPATGFLGRNWYKFDRNVWMREMVEHTAMGFLAVSLKCARCHDHKFDPISQQEYYRFRAFFEPHEFRTDRVSAETELQKDATLGMVLKDGIARVYDKDLSAATYVFERGDDRYPDKEHPLQPGVLEALGHTGLNIQPVDLPSESYFPALRPQIVGGMRGIAAKKIAKAKAEISTAEARVAAAEKELQAISKGEAATQTRAAEVVLQDDFSVKRPDVWTPLSGAWEYRDGKLVEAQVGSFLTIVARQELPRDFRARIRYTHRPEGMIHSVGVAFDVVDRQSWQAIYTYSSSGKSAIQAFHRDTGTEAYPPAGVFPATIEIGAPQTVEIAVRDRQLNVWLNKQLKIVYELPLERRRGGFALWTHSGAAEFDDVLIERLPDEFQLATAANERKKSPFEDLTAADVEAELKATQAARELACLRLGVAEAESAALTAKIAAEEARVRQAKDFETLAQAASQAEKQARLKQAEAELFAIESQATPDEKKLAAAKSTLEKARQAQQKASAEYSHLGEIYPRQSTGRRLALARWIADAQNPRTARVAVNHIWERHFGRGLVPSVSEFGMRARPRSHPELLDWLAVELTDHGWSMKHIHRLIVNSRTYRLSSAPGNDSGSNQNIDPENVYLWRMNSQRMEAEVVRDSVLHLAGALDLTPGGPEIDEKLGQTVLRRSLYFRITPNETMEFLELFDLANPDECYERKESVIPQQSLALMNSALALSQSRALAQELSTEAQSDDSFITAAFEQVLARGPTDEERQRCLAFLEQHPAALAAAAGGGCERFPAGGQARRKPAGDAKLRARENLVHVLFSHNDFITVR